ncbi:PREDICTED: LOC109946780, partial [Prunus dulcis]
FWDLPASSTALKVLFDSWDFWVVHAGEETHKFMVQTIKDINAQVIEDPSLTRNIGGQSVHAGEVIVNSVIAAGDLELPSGDEEGETHVELPAAEVTPSGRKNKRKKIALVYESTAQPDTS